jgi:hypothetical protein
MSRQVKKPIEEQWRHAMLDGATNEPVMVSEAPYSDFWLGREFESLCVLPVQYYPRRNHGAFGGEFLLLLALLQDAIRCYFLGRSGKTHQKRLEFWEIKRWFEDRDDSRVFGFENVCELLGIDSDSLRGRLERTSRGLSELAFRHHRLASDSVVKRIAGGRKRCPRTDAPKSPSRGLRATSPKSR